MTPNDSDDDDYAGMTLAAVWAKHHKLRGTDALKYPPTRGARCKMLCGLSDMLEGEYGNRRSEDHQCFLAPFHAEDCEFSSECVGMHREEGVQ